MEKPLITIGIPIFNEEKFIKQCLESILSQTYTNFEVIISDNVSTDNTSKICEEFAKMDDRIRYVRQKKHLYFWSNFGYLLNQSQSVYFVWHAADDIWENTFLEKNIFSLEQNKKFVGSISQIERYGGDVKNFDVISTDSFFQKKYKKFRSVFRPFTLSSICGEYFDKAQKFLNVPTAILMYSVFRTNELKKYFVEKKMAAIDYALILNILESGDLNVLDEILLKYYTRGRASKGYIANSRMHMIPYVDAVFPFYTFLNWVRKKFGIFFFLSNFKLFFRLFMGGVVSNIREIFSAL